MFASSHHSVCMYVCVCLQTFGSLICFGSVWWAGHEANYLLKGKSEPNEPHWATEVTGLIKHSVCITGRLTQDPTVCWIFTGQQRFSIDTHVNGIGYQCTNTGIRLFSFFYAQVWDLFVFWIIGVMTCKYCIYKHILCIGKKRSKYWKEMDDHSIYLIKCQERIFLKCPREYLEGLSSATKSMLRFVLNGKMTQHFNSL